MANQAIPVQDARALFTKTLVDVYKERPKATSFLRSFFPTVIKGSQKVSIEVQRGTEKIAVDVERGVEGNANQFTKSTEKMILPPYFREYFFANQLDLYDRLFGTGGSIDSDIFSQFIDEVADKVVTLREKIERAYEKQCADVFETGIITLKDGSKIDFKRKAASKVAFSAATNWALTSVSPYKTLEDGCKFLRTVGKSQGGTFNAIMGEQALNAMLENDKFIERNDLKNLALDSVNPPQRDSEGATLHGVVSAGSYRVQLWTYPEYYEDGNGSAIPYVNEKKVILLPNNPKFKLAFAAVPKLMSLDGRTPGAVDIKGDYVIGEHLDTRKDAHVMDIKSAGVAIPTSVDRIYTVQVVS